MYVVSPSLYCSCAWEEITFVFEFLSPISVHIVIPNLENTFFMIRIPNSASRRDSNGISPSSMHSVISIIVSDMFFMLLFLCFLITFSVLDNTSAFNIVTLLFLNYVSRS